MKSVSLTKLLLTSVATIGLLVGCAGSETKEEVPATAQPAPAAVKQETEAQTDSADNKQSDSAVEASTDDSNNTDSAAANDTYEVVNGDNLWNISGKNEIYSDPYQWPLIYKANRDKIKDADLIYSGQTFDIDRSASQSDIDSAINHAKTRGAWTLGEQEASDSAYLGN